MLDPVGKIDTSLYPEYESCIVHRRSWRSVDRLTTHCRLPPLECNQIQELSQQLHFWYLSCHPICTQLHSSVPYHLHSTQLCAIPSDTICTQYSSLPSETICTQHSSLPSHLKPSALSTALYHLKPSVLSTALWHPIWTHLHSVQLSTIPSQTICTQHSSLASHLNPSALSTALSTTPSETICTQHSSLYHPIWNHLHSAQLPGMLSETICTQHSSLPSHLTPSALSTALWQIVPYDKVQCIYSSEALGCFWCFMVPWSALSQYMRMLIKFNSGICDSDILLTF